MDDLDRSPLPLTIKPFCHKPIVLGIRSTTGTCKPCLRDYDPCGGSNLPFCGKLNYTASSASCRDFVGLGGGYDYQGHNPNRGLIVMGAATAADPCTPEAKLANLNGFAIPTSGASDCGDYEQVTYLLDTGYERAYFCSCPDNATVGYQCRVTNLPQALLRGPTDNGQRCVKCGLNGQQCGSGNDYPCCDFHTCTSGICLPNNCTLEGERTNFDGVATNCCGGINFHRNDKDKRCTNCHCGGLGANCESGIDCCGTDTICRKVTSLTLQCEECIPDFAVNSPGRNCTSVYDCCQSLPLYEDPFAESYSFCYQQYECRPCRRENESCDQYDTCCGRLDCNFSVNNGTCLPLPE
ncbi:uncharacterized protein LOC118434442 [Folsomia candida]|nr:uncharacterized protein LOC118434442 [Folsomia candida]